MENRFSRASSSRSATANDIDDALFPAYHQYRPGPSLVVNRRPVPSPSRDNVQPRPSSPENVFADPADSPPPSPTGSAFYSNSIVTPTPSVRRPSLSLSARRSPSPLPGGNGGYYSHHRLSQSLTPSVRSSSSSTYGNGNGLNRSNTTGTNGTGYSTLSSIPSNLSDFTSPPSPLPPIAPVRPQYNYGGHQQNIYPDSVHTGSVVLEEDDPFADGFMIPVGDGFAPHHQRPPPALVFPPGANRVGGVEPPPYTRYPEQPKPEDDVGVPLEMHPSNGDSGIDVGRVGEEDRRNNRQVLAAVDGVGLLGGAGVVGGGGDRGDPDDDGSGARKEWEQKRVLGFKLRAIVLGVAIALVVLLAVGLGVGLGIGLKPSAQPATTSYVYPALTTTTDLPPPSEETGPPLSSPNDTFPIIPTGLALIDPLYLDDYSSTCSIIAEDNSAPPCFNSMGADLVWSCQFDQSNIVDAHTWRFQKFLEGEINMENWVSQPDFLWGAEYGNGNWGGYLVSSLEGIRIWEDKLDLVKVNRDGKLVEYAVKPPWRDGTQNQPFWKIPFALYNDTDNHDDKLSPRNYNNHSTDSSYNFGVFFNKTVIIKDSTIEANLASGSGYIATGNGSILHPGEIVWKCIWEKTLLEVEVLVDIASQAVTQDKEMVSAGNEQGAGNDDDNNGPQRPNRTHGYDNMHHDGGGPHPTGPPLPPPTPGDLGDDDDGDDDGDFFRLHPSRPTPSVSPQGNLSLTYKHRPRTHHRRTATSTTGGPVGAYPLRVSVKESRPSSNRIRQLLGMDLTDPDPLGLADLGKIKCTQFIVTGDGGLTPFVDPVTGEGFVVLKEQGKAGSGSGSGRMMERMRERDAYSDLEEGESGRKAGSGGGALEERNPGCFCQWSS